jgi:hypothetical protein
MLVWSNVRCGHFYVLWHPIQSMHWQPDCCSSQIYIPTNLCTAIVCRVQHHQSLEEETTLCIVLARCSKFTRRNLRTAFTCIQVDPAVLPEATSQFCMLTTYKLARAFTPFLQGYYVVLRIYWKSPRNSCGILIPTPGRNIVLNCIVHLTTLKRQLSRPKTASFQLGLGRGA